MAKTKPKKPRADFPLYAHACGSWAKRINGKIRYFGKWDAPQKAFERYLAEKDYWEAGIDPPKFSEVLRSQRCLTGLNLQDGVNLFLGAAKARVQIGELGMRSWKDYKFTGERLSAMFDRFQPIADMGPAEWQRVMLNLTKGAGPTTVSNEIARIKSMMRWLFKQRYIEREPHYGADFRKPRKLQIRRERARETTPRWFQNGEIRTLLLCADQPLKSMILLGINCGFGNGDCSQLQWPWLDLKNGWVDYARPKTGVDRRCPLWPETIDAILEWESIRPEVSSKLVFVTKYGNSWSDPDSADCLIAKHFTKLLDATKLRVSRRGFYGLRRTFETVAGGTIDQVAVDHIMGHVDQSMAGVYRQRIEDERLQAVTDYVHKWLFFCGPWQISPCRR